MTTGFTGKSVPKGVSLPTDMWDRLEAIRERDGVPVSVQVQRALERDWERDGAHTRADTESAHQEAAFSQR